MRDEAVLIILILTSSTASAQQQNCTVPATVIAPALSDHQKLAPQLESNPESRELPKLEASLKDPLWSRLAEARAPVRSLGADAFVATEQGRPVPIRAVSTVGAQHRIVFVVENGKEMPAPARQIEAAVIGDIVSRARKEDSFALLTARGPRVALGFGSSRGAIGAAAQALADAPRRRSDGESARAAVIEATTWLQPSQPGDSIFLLVQRLDKRLDVSFNKVRDAVAAARVHVVGFQLGIDFAMGEVGGGYDPRLGFQSDVVGIPPSLSYREAFVLAEDSGGQVVEENTEQGKHYRLTAQRLDGLKRRAEELYRGITDQYLLQLDSIGPKLSIDLAPTALRRIPWVSLSYSRNPSPCPTSAINRQRPCEIPVRVTAPDLSSLSEHDAAEAASRWEKNLGTEKLQRHPEVMPQVTELWERAQLLSADTAVKTGIVDGLAATDFVARDEQHKLAIKSVSTYDGPHRIIFVVENGSELPPAARDLESALILRILSIAAPDDSFALLTARGPRQELGFGSTRTSIEVAAQELKKPPSCKTHGKAMRDALLEGVSWLRSPQPGDSIFALGAPFGSALRAGMNKVRAALAAAHVRLFFLQIAPETGFALDRAATLAASSGGWASRRSVWNVAARRYDPPPGLLNDIGEMYMEITKHYLVKFDSFGSHLTIELAPSVQAQHPRAEVRFPHDMPACSNTPPATRAAPGTSR